MIDSLGRGGAEILLKNIICMLKNYDHIIVYGSPEDDLQNHFPDGTKFSRIDFIRIKNLPAAIRSFRKMIKKTPPLLVHSHLQKSSLFTRIAVPAHVPLVNTLHSLYSKDAFFNKMAVWAERLTLKKRHHLIAVSKAVLEDYLVYVPFKGKRFVLYNFLPDIFFHGKIYPVQPESLKCIAVGNLRQVKNYEYLLDVFSHLNDTAIELDIFGNGDMKDKLQQQIDNKIMRVKLCGNTANVKEILLHYNLFVQASEHEGFGVSVVEAMASRVPLVLSDIPVFREITGGYAHFFPLDDVKKAACIIRGLASDETLRNTYVEKAFAFCRGLYNESEYLNNLNNIYKSIINQS